MEGPRGLRKEELASLRAMTDIVFRPGLVDQYPQLFNEDNFENLRVCLDDEGRCVCHIGMTERGASLFGCPIQVCCIGAVSTHPDFRGQGLASAAFDDAVDKAYRDGVDVMIVSGSRNLYTMRGCLHVGNERVFSLKAEELASFTLPPGPEVTVEPMKDDELPLVMDCYRREPARFLRPLDDYRFALNGMVMNRFSDFLVIRDGGAFSGYVILQQPHDLNLQPMLERRTGLAEFAGDRRAILAALPEILQKHTLLELSWQVQNHDALFRTLCEGAGLKPRPTNATGTVKLINYPQLMERMRPRFEEILGWHEAARLAFWQKEEQYGFRYANHELVTDRDTATRLVFGTRDGTEWDALAEQKQLAKTLKTILPLPCLRYGINYV